MILANFAKNALFRFLCFFQNTIDKGVYMYSVITLEKNRIDFCNFGLLSLRTIQYMLANLQVVGMYPRCDPV